MLTPNPPAAGGGVKFSISSYFIISYYGGWSCSKTFTEASNHAWWVQTGFLSGTYGQSTIYGQGNCDINMGTKTAYNVVTTGPGAASRLRNYALYNYNVCAAASCGYYTNITNVSTTLGQNVITPTSNYASIDGYGHNRDIWATAKFYVDEFSLTLSDPDLVFKEYLTTPMMNFYLARIPWYFSNQVPVGKKLYDFHISQDNCLCYPCPAFETVQCYNPWASAAINFQWTYNVFSGYYIKNCGFIGIANM